VNGQRVDQLSEEEMMAVRADLGMIFQEGALFDSLTVRENVGYKLYEETDMPLEEIDKRVEEVLGFIGLRSTSTRCHPSCRAGSGAASRSPGRWRSSRAFSCTTKATTGLDPIHATTVDEEIIKLRDLENVSSIVVTHQLRDAFYVATHMAQREANGQVLVVRATPEKEREAEFIMLKDGLIIFEGDADALRASRDPYIQEFLT
jgi:phospholipid/cholesterol/gamma-HCH transport system ATP-binding protein